ncbi:hypothetical protein PYW07_012110 [Mythimna separata]|uniref:Tubulin polyglutamylase ttll-15 n=1 Tax=Mythimna separata TaxID=271217 RepID=A0AAD7YKK4_MYTSE|nr:hypothetical protein PYW07_012110 [Mythimna separata]
MENESVLPECEENEVKALNNNVIEKNTKPNNNIVEEDKHKEPNKRTKPEKSFTNIFFLVCIVGISLGILLEVINGINRGQKLPPERPKYWVYSNKTDVNKKNSVLKHIHLVLERIGYEKSTNATPWKLLWSWSNPFSQLNLRNLSADQKVNHFPGTGFISSKVVLATSNSKYIPKAFRLPKNKEEFLKYAEENKNALFVQKSNAHRHVYIKNVSDIDVSSGKSFVQEYVQKPFLVDGHKFDIGVYVVITSVNPLRVYWYKGDVLFRYCMEKYYPFDPTDLDKYIVGDDYMPTWEVPSLKHSYTTLGNTMKEAFDIYVRSKGKDPTTIWKEVQKAIAEVFLMKESFLIDKVKLYKSPHNFFEMLRFDFILDEDLRVYLLEANMGPNLSSNHYPPNRLLYEQVIYNLFSLTGVARAGITAADKGDIEATKNMVSAEKNIAVFGDLCRTTCLQNCDAPDLCSLCKPCLTDKLKRNLLTAHTEFLHKGDFRRIFPPPMTPNEDMTSITEQVKDLSENNKLLYLWYQGKCNQDITWCT